MLANSKGKRFTCTHIGILLLLLVLEFHALVIFFYQLYLALVPSLSSILLLLYISEFIHPACCFYLWLRFCKISKFRLRSMHCIQRGSEFPPPKIFSFWSDDAAVIRWFRKHNNQMWSVDMSMSFSFTVTTSELEYLINTTKMSSP